MMHLFITNSVSLHWSCVVYLWIVCDVFISCLDSDGTHSLQRIHCDVMIHFSESVPMKKQINLNLGWPEDEDIFSKLFFWGGG